MTGISWHALTARMELTSTNPHRCALAAQAGAQAAASRILPAKLNAKHARVIQFSINRLHLAERFVTLLVLTITQRVCALNALMEHILIQTVGNVKHAVLGAQLARQVLMTLLSQTAQAVLLALLSTNTLAERHVELINTMTGQSPIAKTVPQALSLIPKQSSVSHAPPIASHVLTTHPSNRHAIHVLLLTYWTSSAIHAEHPVPRISLCTIKLWERAPLVLPRPYLRTQHARHAQQTAHHAQETQRGNSTALAV